MTFLFGRDQGQWAGTDSVFFSVAEEDTFTAIAVRRTSAERQSILGK
jgi:hypothetical protein